MAEMTRKRHAQNFLIGYQRIEETELLSIVHTHALARAQHSSARKSE
jgi:hypothetical protein